MTRRARGDSSEAAIYKFFRTPDKRRGDFTSETPRSHLQLEFTRSLNLILFDLHLINRFMASSDGFAGATLFNQGMISREQLSSVFLLVVFVGFCYTYDDVIFHPGFIDFSADQVCRYPSVARWLLTYRTRLICLRV